MSDPTQQPSGSSSAGQGNDGTTSRLSSQQPARPLRGVASLRGAASLRGGPGRGASLSSSASMVPSRSSYASPAPGAPGSAGPGSGVRMQFRPVMPQRRKASESPAPPSSTSAEASSASPLSTPHSSGSAPRGSGRGRGRGGARPPRQPTQMTASGPFALGPSARPTGKKVAPVGPGGSSLTPASGSDASRSAVSAKTDPDRASYRNPDKLKDAEQYSDPEDGGVEIVDMDEVHILDELAPRSLPRVAEKESKKDKQKAADARQKKVDGRLLKDERDANPAVVRVKSEDPDDPMGELDPAKGSTSSAYVSSASATPQPEVNNADALDLSESEGEELMDDLVDDFVLHDDDDVSPENRLYLFQFPQLFPRFKAPKPAQADVPAAADETSKRRSVSFAEGTTGGAGHARPSPTKHEISSSDLDSDADSEDEKKPKAPIAKEGLVGKLDVYRDGRVFLRFGELLMEVTGGSQSTFLQQVMLLDPSNRTATNLGELHRKFIVSPELDCMLNDISLYDEEKRVEEEETRRRDEEKAEAERIKYGGGVGAAGFGGLGGR
ncbi:related to RPC53-47 kD subunit of DNA-directed RNA polymerase III [Sporisorium reilianum f. sp. reilianum]|uniref:Related to RPC53-47 kD subunit of DNA-directed RNA polymerase III n=1 Tax=Sporisorium reilianum f. sp. reilianum TaxID=72559 RepID=A0A2N8UKN5_9BASI|nr:related to RPC53-47 kD subunit of DNA-directed RNA polymerase III [Sporisorium reilianum f. sp. reilianum]